MPRVFFVQSDETVRMVDIPEGTSVMQAAVMNGVAGIIGECGGGCMCASCHIYVDKDFIDRIPSVQSEEEEMLECVASERKPESRLGCQIKMTSDLDGLHVFVPEEQ